MIKSLNAKKNIRNCSSHSSINTPLRFDYFYLVSISTYPQDPVWLKNHFVNTGKSWQAFYVFLQIYHFYYNEKLRVDKLASFTIGYKILAVFVCYFLRTCQTKFFDTNSEYIKRTNKFWAKIYSENRQLFESFYRFHFTFMYLEKSIFCASQPGQ